MYKLTIRRQWFLFVGSLLLFLGLVIWLPSHSPDKVVKLPLLVVITAQILVAFGFAYFVYQSAPLPQKITAAFTFLMVATGIGTIGTLTSDVNQSLGVDVLVSWIQLVIMNLGGGVATVALYELGPGPGFPKMQEATSEVVRTVKPRASVSATRLPALPEPLHPSSGQDLADLETPAQPAVQPPVAPQTVAAAPQIVSAPPPAIQTPKDLSAGRQMNPTPVSLPAVPTPPKGGSQGIVPPVPAIPEQPIAKVDQPDSDSPSTPDSSRRGVTITNQRIQVQSKRKPSTFTKLQALSATGRSLTAPAGSGLEAEGLKSILDRLEDQAEAAREPSPINQPAAKTQVAPAEASPAPAAKVVQPPPAEVSQSQSAPPKGSSIASRLVGVVTKNKMPAAQKPSFKFDPEPQGKVEAEAPSAVEASPPEVAGLAGSFGAVEAPFEHTPPVEISHEESAPEATQGSRSNIFESPVDDEMDELFSQLAPAEAQKQVLSGPHAAVEAEVETPPQVVQGGADFTVQTPEEAEAARAYDFEVEQNYEAELPAQEVAAQTEPAAEHLFGAEVDNEIDDIFSALAPAEAQREVVHSPKEAEPVTSAMDEIEIDVPSAEPETETVAEESFQPPPVSQAAPSEPGLFGDEVNEEIDDIFAHLAPPEAQLNVSDRETIKSGSFPKPVQPVEQPQEPPASPAVSSPAPIPTPSPAPTPLQPKPAVEEIAAHSAEAESAEEEVAEQEEELSDEDMPIVNPVTKNIEVREFGRLSSKSAEPKGQQSTTGTMKTIGKLLIDVQAIENIIKGGETGKIGSGLASARIISAQRGEGIKALLGRIDTFQGVTGCLIVGHDGLVIASTVSSGEDKDALGALSSALLSTSNLATLKLEIGKLKQMVILTELGNDQGKKAVTTVLTDVDVGVLAVFFDNQDLVRIDGLLESIHSTIHG